MKQFFGSFSTFTLASLLGFSGVYWALKLSSGLPQWPHLPLTESVLVYGPPAEPDIPAIARFLGGFVPVVSAPPPLEVVPPDIFLHGIAWQPNRPGVALISVGTAPARPISVGHSFASGAYVLTAISPHQVTLAKTDSQGVLRALPALRLSSLPISH
jgi:hypothetical protein